MNALEAMKIKKNGGRLERKLDNGLTEVKIFYYNGDIYSHFFEDEHGRKQLIYKTWNNLGKLSIESNFKDGELHGERIWWNNNGSKQFHALYEDGELIKDYLK